jgi:hypothetical protein
MNFWESLAQAREPEEVQKGWLTVKQVAKEMGKSEPRASVLLRKAMDAGKVEMRPFRILRSGVVRPIPHYRKKG